jgi:hypothetical protein
LPSRPGGGGASWAGQTRVEHAVAAELAGKGVTEIDGKGRRRSWCASRPASSSSSLITSLRNTAVLLRSRMGNLARGLEWLTHVE